MTIALAPETRVIVITVAIDEYDVPPPDDSLHRTQLETLARVNTDVALLRALFESVEYRAAGFQMLEPITGSAGQILDCLTKISTVIRQQKRPLYALLFWSGHGRAWADQARLVTRECFEPTGESDGLPPGEVVNKLSTSDVRALGFLCDVCQGGAASAMAISVALRRVSVAPEFKGFSALFSAYPFEQAKDGLFVEILDRLLRKGPSEAALRELAKEGRGGFSPFAKLLALQDLAESFAAEVEVLRRTNASVPAPLATNLGNAPGLFPNPIWRGDALPINVAEARRRRLFQADVEAHFLPKARGLEPGEPGWFFSGRREVIRTMVAWTDGHGNAAAHNLFVLTGEGGTGKSAIIGRFVTLSDPAYRAAAREQGWNESLDVSQHTVPRIDAIDAALHLRNLTAEQVTSALTELLKLEHRNSSGGQLSSFVGQVPVIAKESGRPICVVLDALDEAEEPALIATGLVRPLAAKGWRILVASRRSAAARSAENLLELLAPMYAHDLDQESTASSEIAEYVERRLLNTLGSPYGRAPELVDRIAHAIGERAEGKFLFARLSVSGLLRRSDPIEPDDLEQFLGSDVEDILQREFRELDSAFAATFERTDEGATTLLAALAWASGDGLPLRDGLWALVASAMPAEGTPFTREHVLWLLREAGRFIVEGGDGDQAIYRLYHESLNEHFRAQPRFHDAHERIAAALEGAVTDAGGWELANPYLLRHLPTHLAQLPTDERLQRLLLDYSWMSMKLQRLGIRALLNDYAKARSPGDAAVASIKRALSTSEHVLAWDTNQLPSQLMGRLLDSSPLRVRAVIEAASHERRYTWLRPLTGSLAGELSLRWLRPLDGGTLGYVALSANSRWAVHSGSDDVFLWDLLEWRTRGMLFQRKRHSFYSLAIADDGRTCLGGHSDGLLSRWSVATGSVEDWRAHDGELIDSLAISADGTRALSSDQSGRIVAWNFPMNRHDIVWDGVPRATAMSIDDSGNRAIVAREDGSIYLLGLSPLHPVLLFTMDARPMALACTWDNGTVFAAGSDGVIQSCPMARAARPIDVLKLDERPTSLALSPDDRYLIVGTDVGTVAAWDIEEARYVARFQRAHTYEVNRVGFCSDRGSVISADRLHLKEWPLEADNDVPRISVPSLRLGVVMVEDLRAASVLEDGRLALWRARTGAIESLLPECEPATASLGWAKGMVVASAAQRVLAWYGGLLSVWDLQEDRPVGSLAVGNLNSAAISTDGERVIFANAKDVKLWHPGSPAVVTVGSHSENVRNVAVSQDGKLALSSGDDRTVMLWTLETPTHTRAGSRLRRMYPDARDKPTQVAFASNEQAIFATGDGSLFVFDTRSHTSEVLALAGGHGSYVNELITTSDGRAMSASHATIKVWDLQTQTCVTEIRTHTGHLMQRSARDDRVLLSTYDGVLKVVSLEDGRLVAAFQADKQLIACAADADMQWIAACDQSGEMHFLHLEEAQ